MKFRKILTHWRSSSWQVRQKFGRPTLAAIEQAITASEKWHRGELRFVIEGRLSLLDLLRDTTSRQRALQVFEKVGAGETAEHSGILIYVLLAERQVEIVADRGITAKVPQPEWDALCRRMTEAFASGRYREGALEGIHGATALLVAHFPAVNRNPNELDDAPLIL
jgi:uncharacterized membrane protein